MLSVGFASVSKLCLLFHTWQLLVIFDYSVDSRSLMGTRNIAFFDLVVVPMSTCWGTSW